jgi:hypothetical protein
MQQQAAVKKSSYSFYQVTPPQTSAQPAAPLPASAINKPQIASQQHLYVLF